MLKILLADNHQIICDGLRTLLEREQDMQVVGEASDGRTAVRLAAQLRPDVVVMDVMMPELNGLEATRQIRSELPKVKVIALSMHADKRYVLGMLEAGAAGYVLKESAFQEIAHGIRVVAGGQVYLTPAVASVIVEDYSRRGIGPRTRGPAAELSPREREVLQLLAEGWPTQRVGKRLHVSVKTVETHRRNIMRKLELTSLADLVRYAIREGISSLDREGIKP